jgi:hypothetical protein
MLASHRLSSQRWRWKHAVIFAAVFVLLAPALFPHVHVASPRRVSVSAADRCTVGCLPSLASAATDDGGDADQHSPASCPLCRAQSDARSSLLPPALAVPMPVAAPAILDARVASAPATDVRGVAAPRAPPFAS